MNGNHPVPLHILIVEDSPDDAQLIISRLEQDGLEAKCQRVDTEADFKAALAHPPDLILADYSLPQFSGLRALQIIKEQNLNIPLILISGVVDEEIIVRAIKQGADDYVMKDRPARLASAIQNALNQKRLRQEKQRAIEALHKTEEHLDLFFTQSLDGIFFMMLDEPIRWDDTVDKEKILDYVFSHQRITKINDAMLAQYGASSKQFIGQTPNDFFAHDLEQGRKVWRKFFDAGHLDIETDERRFDGTQMWIEGDYVCLYDDEGRITGHFGIQRDVTERKRALDELRKAEIQFRTLVESIPPIVYISGVDQHIGVTYISPRIAMLGFTQEEWVADPELWFRQIHPDDQKKVLADIQRSIDSGRPFQSEYRLTARDGSVRWFIDEAMDVLDDNGNPSFRQGSMLDITERKLADEKLRQLSRAFEQSPASIVITDTRGNIQYVNPKFAQTTGYTAEEVIGRNPRILQSGYTSTEEYKKLWKTISSGGEWRGEFRNRKKNGELYWESASISPIFNEHGEITNFIGIKEEITARKQTESALSARERYMSLLNEMTRAVLFSDDYDSTMYTLAVNMKKIIDADDCYLLRWDEEKKLPVPVTTTANLNFPFDNSAVQERELSITASILRVGRVVAIEDVYNSQYINVEIVKRYPVMSIIGIPLIAGDQRLGVAIIAFNSHHLFTEEELGRAEQAGNQVALALLELQQTLEIQRRLKESNTLTEISSALSETERVGTDRVLQLIVDSARDLIQQADESVIHLLDADAETLIPRAISGFTQGTKASERPRMGLKEGVAGHVIATGESIKIGDINASSLYVHKETLPTYLSLLVAPVLSGGQPIGTISVQSNKPDAFSANDIELLGALSIQAAIALENSRLFEATQQSLKEVNALYRTIQGLASSLDTDELIEDVVNLLQQNFGYYHVQIYLLDPENGDAVLKSGSGETGARMLAAKIRLPRGIGIVSHVVETALPFVANNVNDIVFFFRNPFLPDTQSEMTVPIKVDGEVVGVIDIQERPPNRLTDNDLQLMVAVADQLSVALQKASLYANLQTALEQEQMVRSQLIQSERLALVGRLLASVSHELNNPLQAIQNALFLLKDEEQLSSQGQQDLDIILAETERMSALIERLRSAYRPGRVKDFRPVELNSLVEDVHSLISTHMRQKQIMFEFHPEPDLPPISGMSDQIRQVVLNLFLNAIEVMDPGGRLFIRTQSLLQQNEVLLTVKDTGPGIAPDILPKIFDAFITDKQTGTGLGLTISRDIIEQHFGRITAENDPEGGAIFNIWLPVDEKGRE